MQHRFLLTILPSPALSVEVERLKSMVHERVGSFSGRNTVPHITLCFLDVTGYREPAIIEAIAHGASSTRGFTLHYNGITHFPDKRTIYIDPVEKDAIATVRGPIITALKINETLRVAIRETDHAHLTIAAGLKPAQFDTAWEILAPHVLLSNEQVTEVVLLKRPLKPGERYDAVRSFPLE